MLTNNIKSTLKDAAQKLLGPAKRAFIANVTNEYFDGSSRKVESHLGWSRHTVHKGLKELETGFVRLDHYAARGRKKTEETLPTLETDIHHLVQEQSQVTNGASFLQTKLGHREGYEARRIGLEAMPLG